MTEEVSYNPYDNRNVAKPLSNFGAFLTLLNCVVGAGVLALPIAFYYAGIVTATLLFVLSTGLLVHGIKLLIGSMVECSRRMEVGYANYPESVVYSFRQGPRCFRLFAKVGAYFVDGMMCLSHYGMCVVYIVLLAVMVKQILGQYIPEIDVRIYVAIIGLLSVPTFLIRQLSNLVPINLLATSLVYFSFIFMFYFLFLGLPPISERRIVSDEVMKLGLFFGIALFSVGSVGVMLLIESMMETPLDYSGCCGIINMSFATVLVSYIVFGVFGYWRFGDQVAGIIILNLPKNQPVALVSNILMATSIFLTYPLCGYVVIDIIMNHYWNRKGELKDAKIKEFIVRIVFVILTTLNALMAPNLIPLLSLIGALTISLLNLIFPAIMEICLCYPPEFNYGKHRYKLWKDIFIIIIGTYIFLHGTYVSIMEMIETWDMGNVHHRG